MHWGAHHTQRLLATIDLAAIAKATYGHHRRYRDLKHDQQEAGVIREPTEENFAAETRSYRRITTDGIANKKPRQIALAGLFIYSRG